MSTTNSRRLGWSAAALASLLLAWTMIGFLFVPWYAQRELPRLAAEARGLDLRIGELTFNPFTLGVRVTDMSLRERSGQPLLGFAAVSADLEWRSLLRGAWVLSEVLLTAPSARVEISEDGRLNLAALLPREPSAGTPRFSVGRLSVQGGRVEFEDRREGYRNQFDPIALDLSSLSTDDAKGGGYTLRARSASGAKLQWKGELSLAALSLSGVLGVEDAQLAEFTPYMKDIAALRIGSGSAAMELPYRLTLPGGKPQLEVKGGKIAVRDLALFAAPAKTTAASAGRAASPVTAATATASAAVSAANATTAPIAKIQTLRMEGVDFDLAARRVNAQTLAIGGMSVEARRGADGTLDLARLFARPATVAAPGSTFPLAPATASTPGSTPVSTPPSTPAVSPWQAAIAAVEIDGVSARYSDATAKTPVTIALDGLSAKLGLDLTLEEQGARARADASELSIAKLVVAPAASTPGTAAQPALAVAALTLKLARFDTATNMLDVATARVGSLRADAVLRQDRLSLLDLLPAIAASPSGDAIIVKKKSPASGDRLRPFIARIKALELADGSINLSDEASGVALALVGITARLGDLSSDSFTSPTAGTPVQFETNATLKSGGRLALRGRAVPGTGAVDARVDAAGVSLALLQPLLARRSVRLVSGEASLSGALTLGGSAKAKPSFSGSAAAGNVVLEDSTGVRLVEWKALATESLRLSWPDQIDIDELRVVAPAARFAIAKDGSSNISRAFARKDGATAAGTVPQAVPAVAVAKVGGAAPSKPVSADPAQPAMAVNIRRLRLDQGALDFSDDNISPGFVAKVHELAGTANGLSTDRETRSQFAFEGRVDEFGYARLSGSINAFAPRDRTAFRVQMRNIDLARVSPYSIKFAGYRIASGRMELDLNYRVRGNVIEGDNHLTLQQLTLGDKVDSPDAFKLPLELAIALLKDADGRIELELPVTGSLDDPQFSIAPLVWKAIGNLVGSIITAPFRALGRLFGGSSGGEDMGTIGFEPGAARLLPPEREKIQRVVEMMGKRPELKLAIPARFDTLADARALRRDALARDIGRRAGYVIADGETPGPVNTDDQRTRAALRALFAERFSPAELDRLKSEAEARAGKGGSAGEAGALVPASAKPALLDRLRNLAAGEPQVVDAREFYGTLLRRLRDAQPLPPGALAELGDQRAAGIEAALRAAGTDGGRLARTAGPSSSDAEAKQVSVSLSVSAR